MVASDTLGHHVAVGLGGGELYIDGFLSQFALCHQVGQRQVGVGTRHEVGVVVLEQVVFHPFRHAAEHTDDQSGRMRTFVLIVF